MSYDKATGERANFGRMMRAGIRGMHSAVMQRPLEKRLAIYFHQVELSQWSAFRACFEHLAAAGYRSVDLADFLTDGPTERRIFVSFDDNFRNWHRMLPLLDELGVRATFYVNTLPFRDRVERSTIAAYLDRLAMRDDHETLSTSELLEIHAAGHTIGCHSHSHFRLSGLPRAQWESELLGSKQILEDLTGAPVRHFAWPYGMRRYFSPALADYCRAIGFETIANAIPGCQKIATRDRYDLYRTDWRLDQPVAVNLANLAIDGRLYARLTGRSVIG